jgi:MMP 1-O-methyltransferase
MVVCFDCLRATNEMLVLPTDLEAVIETAWVQVRSVAGFLQENEARFLGLLAACAPASGAIVEIGSFKGRSTVMLASIAKHYGLGPVVAIDPHTTTAPTDPVIEKGSSTFEEFQASLRGAGVESQVEIHRACSRDVAKGWTRPIRLLWIDGDHTYAGVKEDFDLFSPFVSTGGIVAFHDVLHGYEGPIRVLVEEVLRSDRFGPAGFVQSLAWSQFRPEDGATFRKQRQRLARRAAPLLPLLANGNTVKGFSRLRYNLHRFRVPHGPMSPAEWAAIVSRNGTEA